MLLIAVSCGYVSSQTDYPHGNAAYISESETHGEVTINGGNHVYTYDHSTEQYGFQQYILIPDLTDTPNGNYRDSLFLYGYGSHGTASDTAFQWDAQTFTGSSFDRVNMFVSPLSENSMNYATALSLNAGWCYSDTCPATISAPDSTLAWPEDPPFSGIYELWEGEELVNAGDIKGTGTDSKHSQQQLDTGSNQSYCVSHYGRGWRLPTDAEVGHFNDEEGLNNGFDEAYRGTSEDKYLWTCSLFKVYEVKRWPARVSDGYWENCSGFLYTPNYVRCVFCGPGDSSSKKPTPTSGLQELRLYPNPARENVRINTSESGIQSISIISSSTGQIIKQAAVPDEGEIVISVEDISSGSYIVKIICKDDKIINKKLIIRP